MLKTISSENFNDYPFIVAKIKYILNVYKYDMKDKAELSKLVDEIVQIVDHDKDKKISQNEFCDVYILFVVF